MGQKKLKRFAEVRTFPNFFEYPQGKAGKWREFFGNNHPLILELACGKGEYTLGLAKLYPSKNYIGLDLKSNRIWVGARRALSQQMQNVAFIRTQIDKLTDYFGPGEVAEIWLTFPDPQLRLSKAKKRLTHPRFLRLYHQVLQKGGNLHLKTDSPELYDFTKLVISLYGCPLLEDLNNIYTQVGLEEHLKIQTHYETLDIAKSDKVHYLKFCLPEVFPPGNDEQLKGMVREDIIH